MELPDQKQHYVPQALLKRFAGENGNFYHRSLLYPKHTSITNTAKVCYGINFYDPQRLDFLKKNGIDDIRYLELNGFVYENTLKNILSPYESGKRKISKYEFEVLIEMYLNIKYRNKATRNKMEDKNFKGGVFESTLLGMKKEYEASKYAGILLPIFDRLIPEVRERFVNDEGIGKEHHLQGLYDSTHRRNQAVNDTIWQMLGMEVFVVLIKNEKEFFLTSDNPGFTFYENRDLHRVEFFNTDYGRMTGIGFPISSKMAIMLQGFKRSNQFNGDRIVHYSTATNRDIDLFNYGTKSVAMEKIFCENKDYLQNYVLMDELGKTIKI